MGIASEKSNDLYFLSGGGEMGELIRSRDWSITSMGDPANWPERLRTTISIMLTSKFPMILLWGEDLIQFYNDAYRPSLGNEGKHPTALGQKAKDCWPEIWDVIFPVIKKVLKTGESIWSEDQLIPIYRNGKTEDVYWTFSYSPVIGESKKIEGILCICTETTEKFRNIKVVEESELRFRNMIDNIPNLAWMADAEGWIFWYNKKWYDYTGTTPEEMQGWGWKSVHDPTELPSVLSKWQESIKNAQPFEMVFPIKGADGNFRKFLTRVLPVHDKKGTLVQWFGSNTDISYQIKIEQALKESEQNLRNTILQAPVAMCMFKEPDHVVKLANERMFELWGKPAEDVMNKPIFEGLPEAKNQGFEELLDGVYNTGQNFSAQDVPVNLPRNNRLEKVYVNFVYQAYRESNGTISGILAVAIDVTAQVVARQKIEEVVKERTKELENANNDLQKSNAELAQFAYIASHDLQEPLRKIATFAQMLQSSIGNNIDEKSKKYLEKINSSTSRMTNLIRDVLAYSELVKENEIFTEVDLNSVIKNIEADYDLLIEQKEATINFVDLPVVEAIPLQITQLFGNLLGNALKFTRSDIKPVITISVSKISREELENTHLSPELTYYKIKFQDNGIGFKKEYADRIFHIFQRLHRKSDYEGTGIGLAMCKKIAVNHHGELNAIGSSEEGAVFNVILPAKQVKEISAVDK
ncbi:MAG: PAS domain-containing protein [Ferruginibacter sp.]